ncbi:MAG: sugar phosphate isomerase/epimerase [Chloroflexia bacterium]
MWTLTGFADEIDPDLDLQLETLAEESIQHLDLRGAWGKNVLDLTDEDLARVNEKLSAADVKVACIGSPIGKIGVEDEFAPHLERFKRAMHAADSLGAPYIRIFSFFIPEGEDPADHRGEVMDRMGALLKEAEGSEVALLHENEKHIYGDVPSRCLDLHQQFDTPQFRAAWDPANYVQCGVRPYTEGFDDLRPYIGYIHVKDSKLDTGEITPAGEGDGQWPETLASLHSSGFDGFFSLEPHLAHAGRFSGHSGPVLFRKASSAFKDLMRAEGVEWA